MEIALQISKLPNDWKVRNPHGKVKTKKSLEYCILGFEKEGDIVVYFEKDTLEKHSPPHKKNHSSTPCWSVKYKGKVIYGDATC